MTTPTEVKLDTTNTLKFMYAGKAIFTVVSTRTGVRYTYKVQKAGEDRPGQYYVNLLTGSDNTSDYTYMGMIRNNQFVITRASQYNDQSVPVVAFRWVLNALANGSEPKNVEILFANHCLRCGRLLTVNTSITIGYGPECASKAA